MTTPTKALAIKAETISSLDRVAQDYQLSTSEATPFAKTFLLAEAIGHMRDLLTPEVMKPVMALMNTDLGFRTDKDPHVWDSKNNCWHKPYEEPVVRDVLIEATLRGYFPVNNEFNLIAGRFYAAKNGIRRKVTKYPGVTDFKDTYGVPRNVGDKGAIVTAKATWKLGGIADELEREIPVRVNAAMGTDAILGKAERKLLKSVLDRLSGEITPDGEIDDTPTGAEAPTTPKVVVGKATTVKESDLDSRQTGTSASTGSEVTNPVATGQVQRPEHKAQTDSEPSKNPRNASQAGSIPAESAELSEEDKKAIERKEAEDAARELAKTNPEEGLRALMAVDAITEDELKTTLLAFQVKLPPDYKGVESLSDKRIAQLIEPRAWVTFKTHVLNKVRVTTTPDQAAP